MIFVEKSQRALEEERRHLLMETDVKGMEYVAGAVQAIEWMLYGGLPPSVWLTRDKINDKGSEG